MSVNEPLTQDRPDRPPWLCYGSAPLGVAAATFAALFVDPHLPHHPYYLWFVCAFAFTCWYGGVGPSFLNLLLGPLALAFFVMRPRFSILVDSPDDQFGLLLYTMTALGLFFLHQSRKAIQAIAASVAEQGSLQRTTRGVDEIEALLANHLKNSAMAERRRNAHCRVSQILIGASDSGIAFRLILQAVCEAVGWEVGLFWLVDGASEKLHCIESWGRRTDVASEFDRASREFKFSKGEGFPGRVWKADDVVMVPDMAKDTDLTRWRLAANVGLHQAIGFPVRHGEELLGVMEFIGRDIGDVNEQLVELMNSIGSQLSQFIELRNAEKAIREQNLDRNLARRIQEGLLPKAMPSLPGFQFAARASFASEVGGDYFDFLPMTVECQDCLGLAIGDASGHGVAAALLIAETRAYLQALALMLHEPGTMLSLANRRLAHQIESDHFVTHLLVRLDPGKKNLVYAGAGHCPGYVLDHRGCTKAVLASAGPPLGVDPSSDYSLSSEIALNPGDLILLFTDGLSEASSPEGQMFGEGRLLDSIRQHRKLSPDEILNTLFQAVTTYSRRAAQSDDATAVILKVEAN